MSDTNAATATTSFDVLKADIDRTYDVGRYVAIEGDQVIADADSIRELVDTLKAMGRNPSELQAVQAGIDYPKSAVILTSLAGSIGDE